MSEKPLLTIVIPTYNAEKTVEKCINSLKKQNTKFAYQVYIINDGSTDKTQNVVESAINDDKYFRVFSKDNSGLSGTRNFGLARTNTEYITFVDPDDFVNSNYVNELLTPYCADNECDLSITGYQKEDDEGNAIFQSENSGTDSFTANDAMFRIFISGGYEGFTWNKAYRTSIFKKYNLQFTKESEPYEDLYLDLKYLQHCRKIVWRNNITYHYVVHNSSAVHANRPGSVFNSTLPKKIDVLKEMLTFIPSNNTKAINALKAKICWDEMSILRTIYAAPNRNEVPKETIRELRQDNLKYRRAFLSNQILSQKDKLIYWLNWYMPSTFAWVWNTFKLHGRG